jgi:hypothetical protein
MMVVVSQEGMGSIFIAADLVGVGGVTFRSKSPVEDVEREGGVAGVIPVVAGVKPAALACSAKVGPPIYSRGEEGRLAFAGGRPVGVEGGALFLPLRGGVDIFDEL